MIAKELLLDDDEPDLRKTAKLENKEHLLLQLDADDDYDNDEKTDRVAVNDFRRLCTSVSVLDTPTLDCVLGDVTPPLQGVELAINSSPVSRRSGTSHANCTYLRGSSVTGYVSGSHHHHNALAGIQMLLRCLNVRLACFHDLAFRPATTNAIIFLLCALYLLVGVFLVEVFNVPARLASIMFWNPLFFVSRSD